jgi:hypothetical protein
MQHENTLEALEQLVIQWAEDKEIFAKATPIKQGEKTGEEYSEMMRALGKQELLHDIDHPSVALKNDVKAEIADSIGDQIVTLIIGAHMQGLTIGQCLQGAYDVISKRTGTIINGKFVKDNA